MKRSNTSKATASSRTLARKVAAANARRKKEAITRGLEKSSRRKKKK